MSEIEVSDFTEWQSDWEENQAPPNVLLRADNLVLDAQGARTLRPGTRRMGSLLNGPAYTIHTSLLAKQKNRLVVAGAKAYLNGNFLTNLDGSGDAAVDSFLDSVFFARGTEKFRHNGEALKTWGPGTPSPPTVGAAGIAEVEISEFTSGESPGWTAKAGTIADTTDSDGNADSAKLVTVNKKKGSTIQRLFSENQNYSTPNNYEEDSADMISLEVQIPDPTNVIDLTLEFGLGTAADPFKKDKFQFVLGINGVPLKDLPGARPSVGDKLSLYAVPLSYKQKAMNKANFTPVNTTTTPAMTNSAETDDGWTVVAIPRSAFFRVGKDQTKNWGTVRGVRIVLRCKKTAVTAKYDTLQIITGGKAFFGKYQFRLARFRDNGTWTEVGPPSAESQPVLLAFQGASLILPPSELTNINDSVLGWSGYHVYGKGGALDRYYKITEITSLGGGGGMRIDEFSRASTNTNGLTKPERTRFLSVGFSGPGAPVTGSLTTGLTAKVQGDEVEILIRNEVLEETAGPADNMIDCDHHLDRMFQLTSELLSFSPVREASRFLIDQAMRVGDATETPYWIRRTRSAIFIGTSKDIIRIDGSGLDQPDGTVDFFLERLNIPNPPVGPGAAAEGNVIFYQAEDGWRVLASETSTPLDKGGNGLLWRGFERHGILPVATLGRHRGVICDGFLYLVVPHGVFTGGKDQNNRRNGMRVDEFAIAADSDMDVYERARFSTVGFTVPQGGASTVIWRNRLGQPSWDRMTMPAAMMSIHLEPDGTLVGGGSDGYVYTLLHPGRADHTEADAAQSVLDDDAIRISFRSPSWLPSRWGRNDLNELQAFVTSDPGAATAGGGLYLDNALHDSFAVVGQSDFGYYRRQFDEVTFRSAQIRFDADVRKYNLKGIRLNYVPHPPSQIRYDSGLFFPQGKEDLAWLYQIRFLARLTVDVKMQVFLNDDLLDTYDVEAVPGLRTYTRALPKGTKGYALRAYLFLPQVESKQDVPPFEVYWFEFVYSGSGNENDKTRHRVAPA